MMRKGASPSVLLFCAGALLIASAVSARPEKEFLVHFHEHEHNHDNENEKEFNEPHDKEPGEDTLLLAHVIFRHGDRTTDISTFYPNDPYRNETFYPFGPGQLTNEGKRREYRIGKALRRRYNGFLDATYTPDVLDATTTAYNRTKMSLMLVLAGLYPPIGEDQFEDGLGWQPIPYNYVPLIEDQLLAAFHSSCPRFTRETANYEQTMTVQREMKKHSRLFDYLTEHSGWNVKSIEQLYFIYNSLSTEEEWGFDLPEWTKKIWKAPLKNAAVNFWKVLTGNTLLRKLSAGNLLKKIIDDSLAKAEGSLSPQTRKLFLYSGHDFTVISMLSALNIYSPHHPPYGAFVIVELHNIDGVHGFKVFYQDYKSKEPQQMTIPKCNSFCPLNEVVGLLSEYFPEPNMCD